MASRPRAATTFGRLCAALLLGALAACASGQRKAPTDSSQIDQWEDPHRTDWSQPDRIVDALALGSTPLQIVDLGAGSGYFSRRLAKANPQGKVLALEVSGSLRAHIESHRKDWGTPNLETRLVIDNNPLLPEASVDLVFMSNTYRYLSDRTHYFAELSHALRPGGRLAIVDFREGANCRALPECPPRRERVAAKLMQAELQKAGFRLHKKHDFLPHQYFMEFVLRKAPAAADSE